MFETENTWQDTIKQEQMSITLFGQKKDKFKQKKKKKEKHVNYDKSLNSISLLDDSLNWCIDKANLSNKITSLDKLEELNKKNISKSTKHKISDDQFDSISTKRQKSGLHDNNTVSSISPLSQKLYNKLQSSRFRFINEKVMKIKLLSE